MREGMRERIPERRGRKGYAEDAEEYLAGNSKNEAVLCDLCGCSATSAFKIFFQADRPEASRDHAHNWYK